MKTFLEIVRDSIYSITFHLAPRFANVLLFILIGRRLGVHEAGAFTLATTYLLIFSTFMKGLDDLLVREIARLNDGKAANYFANFLLVRVALTLVLQALLTVVVLLLFNYAPDTTQVILIISLSLLPDSITFVAQSVLLARRQYRSSAVILALASGLKLFGGAILILTEGNLIQVAWVMVGGSLFSMAFMLLFAYREIKPITRQDWIKVDPLRKHWRAALSFIAITLLITLETQADTILLSLFRSESEVGWYGAATTIVYSLIMFSQGYRYAVYPLMSRYASESPEKLQQLYKESLRVLTILVLPMIAGIIITAPSLVLFVFGPDFSPTIIILNIISFTLLFMFLNEPTIRLLLVHNYQTQISLFLLYSAILNVSLNLILIPMWGANGAALARVASAFSLFALSYAYIQRDITHVRLAIILRKPVLAAAIMSVVLWPIRDQPLFIVIAAGAFLYLLSLIALGEIKRGEYTALWRSRG